MSDNRRVTYILNCRTCPNRGSIVIKAGDTAASGGKHEIVSLSKGFERSKRDDHGVDHFGVICSDCGTPVAY